MRLKNNLEKGVKRLVIKHKGKVLHVFDAMKRPAKWKWVPTDENDPNAPYKRVPALDMIHYRVAASIDDLGKDGVDVIMTDWFKGGLENIIGAAPEDGLLFKDPYEKDKARLKRFKHIHGNAYFWRRKPGEYWEVISERTAENLKKTEVETIKKAS